METKDLIDEKQLAEIEARLTETKIKLETMVRQYPLTSVAVAIGLGFIIAKLVERKK